MSISEEGTSVIELNGYMIKYHSEPVKRFVNHDRSKYFKEWRIHVTKPNGDYYRPVVCSRHPPGSEKFTELLRQILTDVNGRTDKHEHDENG